jgi:uncharacterized membrane protein
LAVPSATPAAERRALTLVWVASAIQAAIFFGLGSVRYASHRALVDTGLFTQTIASAFSGFSNTFEGGSHWAFHFSPILSLCAPLLLFTHSALALTAVQAGAVALTAPAAYLLARRRTSVRRALVLAGIVLIYPPLAGVEFADFHENAFVPAATLWMLWAVDSRRWAFAYTFLALTLAIKEDQALIVGFAAIAALIVFYRRNDRAGVTFAMAALSASLLVFVAYFTCVRPLVDGARAWQPTRFYAWTPADLTNPAALVTDRLGYLVLALLPLAFIPLRSPLIVLALPGVAECVLSREHATYTMGQHYAAVWIPYVLAAFVVAGAKLRSPDAIRFCAALCVLNYVVANPLHPGDFLARPGPRDARLDAFLARLPADTSVGTQEEAYTHLGFDPNAQIGLAGDPDYVLVDHDYPKSIQLVAMEPLLRRDVAAGTYTLQERDGGIELYRRAASTADKS